MKDHEKIKNESADRDTQKDDNNHPCSCGDLEKEIEALREENQTISDQMKRAVADYRNLEGRMLKEKAAYITYAESKVARQILPVLDNLEKAQESINNEGIGLIIAQFNKVLESLGVIEIEAIGKEFDPVFHESIDIEEGPENRVTTVLEKGYRIGEAVIRPAKVKVGKSLSNNKKDIQSEDLSNSDIKED